MTGLRGSDPCTVVAVWWLAVGPISPDPWPEWENTLDAEERFRAQGFRFKRDRDHFIVAHALKRCMLAWFSGQRAAKVRFESSAFGKPEMMQQKPPRLRFSLSHTPGLVACAVTRECDVGLDVECHEREANMEIAQRYFAPEEAEWLRGRPDTLRKQAFLELWTLKEAYIKGRGLGLSLPLSAFRVSVDPLSLTPEASDQNGYWRVAQMRPTSGHVLAVACRLHRPVSLVMDARQMTTGDLHQLASRSTVEERLGEMCHPLQTPCHLFESGLTINGGSVLCGSHHPVLC